jgi:hypothetical protein
MDSTTLDVIIAISSITAAVLVFGIMLIRRVKPKDGK